ncbi:hypothetical protein GFY24_04160 [Nocardia sp. SYP-A9097]|nr:hypothetical protein [Nocardia sp. SYP-A9097]MRH86670.1 hypothetical protein [Nocardia sp. SYP-A9097]
MLFQAIDSQTAWDGMVFDRLAAAAEHMPMTAEILSGGIADNKKLS